MNLLLLLISVLLLTVSHVVRAEESKTEPPSWLVDGFVASLEDNRLGIVEQALLYDGSLQLFKEIKLTEHKIIVDHIVHQLGNQDLDVRYAAIEALVALDAKDQVNVIAKRLEDPSPYVQRAAIEALAALDAKDQASSIAKLLGDSDSYIQRSAIKALVSLDAKDHTSAIAKLLGPDSDVQYAAIGALATLDAKDQAGAFVKLLEDPDPDVRGVAIDALAALDAKEQASAVAKLLEDTNSEVRLAAIKALISLDAKNQASTLVKRLEDPKPDVRYAAIEALASLDAKNQASTIVKLLEDPKPDVRGAAIKALAALDAKDQISAIVKFLEDPKPDVRGAAIKALVALDAKDQISAIAKFLEDPKPDVRYAAIEALASLDAKNQASAIVKLLGDRYTYVGDAAIKAMATLDAKNQASTIVKLLEDPKPYARDAAFKALVALDAKDQISAIAKFLEDPKQDVRYSAIKALVALDAKDQASAIAKLLGGSDSYLQHAVIEALAALDAKDQASAIAKLLGGSDSYLQHAVIEALAALDAKDQASAIAKLLGGSDSYLQHAVIEALAALDAKDQASAIAKLLGGSDSYLQHAVIEALAALDAKDQASAIAKLLGDSDSFTQRLAIKALVVLDAKDQASAIVKLLEDPDPDVRGVAIEALASLDAKNQASTIVKLLEDPKPYARDAAFKALVALDAKDQISAIAKFLGDSDLYTQRSAVKALVALDAKDQASAIVKLLEDSDSGARNVVIRALSTLGPFSFDDPMFVQILAFSYHDPKEFAKFLFVAHLIGAGKNESEITITWLGTPGQPFKIDEKIESEEGKKILNILNKIWPLTKAKSSFRAYLATKSAELVKNSNWEVDNMQALVLLEDKLRNDGYTMQADFVQGKIERLRAFNWAGFGGKIWLAHALFWLILITAYPRFPMVQAIFFWNPKVRRIIGMGYVGLILTWAPYLRSKLFAPFSPSLRADALLNEFTESAYFAEYRVKPLPRGESQLISKAFKKIEGQIILQGDSGSGKTMLLCALTACSNRIVVFIPAVKCAQGVMAAIQKKLQGSAKDEKFLRNLIFAGAIDIYIDGLNEVSPETRAKISGFAEEYFKANIIMTTQPMEWSFPTTARSYEIEALSRDQIEAFLISRKVILAADAPISSDDYETSCRSYLTSYFEQPEEMIKVAQKVLSNPMDLTTVAHVLSLGQPPDLFNLQQQSYQIMATDYEHTNIGEDFPLQRFSDQVYQMRLEDKSVLSLLGYEQEITCLERHKMVLSRQVNSHGDEKQFRFRHDKIMDFFIVQIFLGKDNDKPQKHLGDPRFRGVYFMLATLMPLADAQVLREQLINFSVETKDHTVSD